MRVFCPMGHEGLDLSCSWCSELARSVEENRRIMERGEPVQRISYEIITDMGRETVSGRPVGEHLAVHRVEPSDDADVTAFVIDHLPTGLKIADFSSEKWALNVATSLDAGLGHRLASMEAARVDDSTARAWKSWLVEAMKRDGEMIVPLPEPPVDRDGDG